MTKANPGTLKIRWIRSGIAFNRKQKEIIRGLGLRRLHQVVERPDNPVVRGLIAKVAHLVEIVGAEAQAATASIPEYVVLPGALPEATPEKRAQQAPVARAAGGEDTTHVAPESRRGVKATEAGAQADESEDQGS